MPRRQEQIFSWIKRSETTNYKVEVDGTDETRHLIEGSFTGGIIGEESSFKLRLDNNNERFTTLYSGGETVDLYLDFADATSKRLRFKIENIKKEFGGKGSVIVLSGANKYHSELLDITVTEEYTTATGNSILKDLVDKYLTGFTYSNVNTTAITMNIKWENTPFYDAVIDICNACNMDCYVDVSADFHLFDRESVINNEEAIVLGDNLIKVDGLQDDLISIKNYVQVVSEDSESLPILYTSEDSTSQSLFGIKERIIKETNVANENQAQEIADFNLKANKEVRGKSLSFFLPSLMPGDFMWIVNQPQQIHSQYRIVRFVHKIPQQRTDCVIEASRDIQTFLKDRKLAEAGLERLRNPFKMKWSYNFPFDDYSNIDEASSNNIEVEDGALKMIAAGVGTMISKVKTLPSDVTEAHLLVVGETLSGITYEVKASSPADYDNITPDQKIAFNTSDNDLTVKITLTNTSTRIKSLALLVK